MYKMIQKIIALLLSGLFEKEDLYKFTQHYEYEDREMILDRVWRAEFILGARDIGTEKIVPSIYVRRVTDRGWYIDRDPIMLIIIEVAIKVLKEGKSVKYLNDIDFQNEKERIKFMEELSFLIRDILDVFELEELRFTRLGKTDQDNFSVLFLKVESKREGYE